MANITEFESDGNETVEIGTPKANIVGTFYDNLQSSKGIILLPGITEHRSSLESLAEILNIEFKVWTFDINSQGDSTGNWNLAEMVESFGVVTEMLKARYGLTEIGAHGNSTGAMAVGIAAAKGTSLDALCLSGAPAGLQDTVAPWIREVSLVIPQRAVRWFTKLVDWYWAKTNENYRNKSHQLFLQEDEKDYNTPYAQFGATKIPSLRKLIEWLEVAPRLDIYTTRIKQPTLFIYGGEDKVNGIKGCNLPEKIQAMINNINLRRRAVKIYQGADHCLNGKTNVEDDYNQDSVYQHVKIDILEHFARYLL
ncbi:MAG: alpha/beta fold hydrolase [Candidatus Woesearchaeota archaeon]